jgi:hypothetical protein
MSLEEVEAKGIIFDVPEQMREAGMTRITRSQFMEMVFGLDWRRKWHPEMEADVPRELDDPYC